MPEELDQPRVKVQPEPLLDQLEFRVKIYKVCRKRIEHQDILTHHRTIFNLTLQGALFASYIGLSSRLFQSNDKLSTTIPYDHLCDVLSKFGIGIGLAGLAGTSVAAFVSYKVASFYNRIDMDQTLGIELGWERSFRISSDAISKPKDTPIAADAETQQLEYFIPLLPTVRSRQLLQFIGLLPAFLANLIPVVFWIEIVFANSSALVPLRVALSFLAGFAALTVIAPGIWTGIANGIRDGMKSSVK
ncbi:MAG: hypothetical protein ABJA67_11545 [Chthonomonadales bacterium]